MPDARFFLIALLGALAALPSSALASPPPEWPQRTRASAPGLRADRRAALRAHGPAKAPSPAPRAATPPAEPKPQQYVDYAVESASFNAMPNSRLAAESQLQVKSPATESLSSTLDGPHPPMSREVVEAANLSELEPPVPYLPEFSESAPVDPVEPSPAREVVAAVSPSIYNTAEPAEQAPSVSQVAYQDSPNRSLGAVKMTSGSPEAPATRPLFDLGAAGINSQSITTMGGALAVVLGLFLLLMAMLRKARPRSQQPLPEEVVSVLGRIPLVGKQTAQLMKVGAKLVLVSITADGNCQPLTEITDPEEVARLMGLVEQSNPQSASAAFQEVFDQIANEQASPGFLGDESTTLIDRAKLAAAYANTPGGRAYA